MNLGQVELQERLWESLRRHNVPGASVAIFSSGKVTAASGGVTNICTGVDLTPDTVMHLGSITKVFNATLVMQLVDDGTVDLDEPVVRYLPDLRLKDKEALPKITVKMLLNHTSGIDGEGLPDCGHDDETLEKGIARLAQQGQVHGPGVEFSYSNAAAVIAGYLAQRMRGSSWYKLVRERIFRPLQMDHAAALPEEALLHRASVGHYLHSNQRLVRASYAFLPLSFAPAGATLMMSASDLLTFASAHIGAGVGTNGVRIVSDRSAHAMQQITVDNRGKGYTYDINVGLAWQIYDSGLVFHGGGGRGIASMLYVHPVKKWAVAFLTNAHHGFNLINEFMEPWLKEADGTRPMGMVDPGRPLDHADLDPKRYVGIYGDSVTRYRVSGTDAGLALSRQMQFAFYETTSTEETRPTRLVPLGDDKFLWEAESKDRFDATTPCVVAFRNPDREGKMAHLGCFLRLYPRL